MVEKKVCLLILWLNSKVITAEIVIVAAAIVHNIALKHNDILLDSIISEGINFNRLLKFFLDYV